MVCGPFLVSTVTSPLTVPAFNSVRICLSACASLPRAESATAGLVPSPFNDAVEMPERPPLVGFEVAALATPVTSTPVPAMPAATRAKRRWWLRRFIEGPLGRWSGVFVDPRIGGGHVHAVGRVYGSCKPKCFASLVVAIANELRHFGNHQGCEAVQGCEVSLQARPRRETAGCRDPRIEATMSSTCLVSRT